MPPPNGPNNISVGTSEESWTNGSVQDSGYVTPDSTPSRSVRRRAPVACRRCRRMRTKCVPDPQSPVCQACQAAGVPPEGCVYLTRGEPDYDREYRHPRVRAGKPRLTHRQRRHSMNNGKRMSGGRFENHMRAGTTGYWKYLPPMNHLIDAVHQLCDKHLQLNFICKDRFCARLHQSLECAHPFLLASILAVSARSTPGIVEHHGSATDASKFFMELASDIAYDPIFREPSLQTCQALYLLSIAQSEHGLPGQSYLCLGTAIRMASLLGYHREETYEMEDPTPIQVQESESARRTMWMLFRQENRGAANLPLTLLPASDITALLPCSEREFAEGREPLCRATLADARLARDRRGWAQDPRRSLFASLTQVYHLWGIVGRQVAQGKSPPDPAEANTLVKIMEKLREWEEKLPSHHVWSVEALREHRANGLDLSFFELSSMLRLCNIAVRKPFLQDILNGNISKFRQTKYKKLCHELYVNVCMLLHQIETHYAEYPPRDAPDPQGMDTCVYECGINAAYICRFPGTCQDENMVENGPRMLSRMLSILQDKRGNWAFAPRWIDELLEIHSLPLIPVADIAGHPLPQPVYQQRTTETIFHTIPKTITTIKTENPSIIGSPVSDTTTATLDCRSPITTSPMEHAANLSNPMSGLSVIIPTQNLVQLPDQQHNLQQPLPPAAFQGRGESPASLPLSAPMTPETQRAFYYTSPTASQNHAFGLNPTFYVGFVAPPPSSAAAIVPGGGHLVDPRSSPSSLSQTESTLHNGQQVCVLRPGQDWNPNVPKP